MKRKFAITGIILSIVFIITVLILTKTPLLHLNEEDTSGKYQRFYTSVYQITKSEKVLSHIIQSYSYLGNNHEQLKPLFDDAFEIRNNYNQDTLEATPYTQLDYFYILYLVTNNKFEEADVYISNNLNEDILEEVTSALSTIYYIHNESEVKKWSLAKTKEIIESDLYQDLIKNEYKAGDLKSTYMISSWSFYAYALFNDGAYDASMKEIEKMALNPNASDFIFAILNLVSDNDSSEKKRFVGDIIKYVEDTDVLTKEEINRLKELYQQVPEE